MPRGHSHLTPEQRSMRASAASNTRWASEDGKAQGKRGQQGLRAKFVRETRAKFPNLDEDQIHDAASAQGQQGTSEARCGVMRPRDAARAATGTTLAIDLPQDLDHQDIAVGVYRVRRAV